MSAQSVASVVHESNLHVLPHAATSTSALVLDGDSLDKMMRLADLMATGRSTVPKHFYGNPADCLAVVMQSMQWKMNPFAVAQKTHLVSGVLGYEAQLINAVITSMAPTVDRLHYEWYGDWEKIIGNFKEVTSTKNKDDNGEFKKYRVPAWNLIDEAGLGVRVWASMRGEDEPRTLDILLAQARTRNSTLWADDPKQQLAYLATKRWSRLYCPDVILGVYSPDEFEGGGPVIRDLPQESSTPEAPAEYPAESFTSNFPKWKAVILSGKKTAADVLATVNSGAKEKGALTNEQREQILSLAPIDIPDADFEEVQP